MFLCVHVIFMSTILAAKEDISLDKMMLLSVCWSANLGGLGMLTGTTPNLVLKGKVVTGKWV